MLDIIFLSYDEPQADENFKKLKLRFPLAKRVHGVKGIDNAHFKAAEKAKTKSFYVVDADIAVRDNFDFSYVPPDHQSQYVHIWMCHNPVINETYGYSGIKLFNKDFFAERKPFLDFSTSLGNGVVYHKDVASDVHFDSSPLTTFRAAYREAFKLAKNPNTESQERLRNWRTKDPKCNNPEWFMLGVALGVHHANNMKNMDVNDFDRIQEVYYSSLNAF